MTHSEEKSPLLTLHGLPVINKGVLFVSGIDTNVGKTYASAALANTLNRLGYKAITQKMIQTGCTGSSEDIEKHRELMQLPLLPADLDQTTCPVILSYPASPHLAAEIDHTVIDTEKITAATGKLLQEYDLVVLEGAGGLMVPISADYQHKKEKTQDLGGYLTIDYIRENNYPVALVTSGKLGSLNHTLLSIDACKSRDIPVAMIIYNKYPNDDAVITESSLKYLQTLGIPVVTLEQSN